MSKFNLGMKACGVLLLWAATEIALPAQTFTTLHSFDYTDGSEPYAGLVQGTGGHLYGTTEVGGANNAGTVFKMTTNGTLTTLYNFCPHPNCTDGSNPSAPLIQATNGNFYGTTQGGGMNGGGTVFKITPSGMRTTVYSFCPSIPCTDGGMPFAGLVQATDGDFYGTTQLGGAHDYGTVFKVTPGGTLTTLYNFCSQYNNGVCADGQYPYAGLVQGADGNFYGTTQFGGAIGPRCHQPFGQEGCGTIFKITPSGTLTTLYSFCPKSKCTDGNEPVAGLVQGPDGNFYGTTIYGGASGSVCRPKRQEDCGTVFKITPRGKLTTLHSFALTDGYKPYAGLVQGTDGNFYGTTIAGGANVGDYQGTIFKITASGTLTLLHSFGDTGGTDGYNPIATLVQDTNGSFYGTTFYGGISNRNQCPRGCGTVFSLSVGLSSFIETQPTSGKVGAAVKILGTSLTGSTSVTFNGTAATFTVISRSEITTTVPAGATTGTVQAVTPSGTLSSNVPFTVN
jgi:uncharacterized repeat protein (TIGR03803 family)